MLVLVEGGCGIGVEMFEKLLIEYFKRIFSHLLNHPSNVIFTGHKFFASYLEKESSFVQLCKVLARIIHEVCSGHLPTGQLRTNHRCTGLSPIFILEEKKT